MVTSSLSGPRKGGSSTDYRKKYRNVSVGDTLYPSRGLRNVVRRVWTRTGGLGGILSGQRNEWNSLLFTQSRVLTFI